MARYRLACACVGQPVNGAYARYGAGTTIADSAGNAIAGDLIWPALCSTATPAGKPNALQLIPLDAAAATALGIPIGTNVSGGNIGAGQM